MALVEDQHPTVVTLRGIFAAMVSKDPTVASDGEQKLIALVEEEGDIRFHHSHQLNSQSKVLATYIFSTLTNMFAHLDTRMAGVRAISVLLDVDFCELSTRTARFSALLLSAANDTSATTTAAIDAWGRLISNGSGLVGDITRVTRERIVQQLLIVEENPQQQALINVSKMSVGEKSEKRFVGASILFQLADRAPTVLTSDTEEIRIGLEKAIVDPFEATRRAAAKALRRFLDLCIRSGGEGSGGGAVGSSKNLTASASNFSATNATNNTQLGLPHAPSSSGMNTNANTSTSQPSTISANSSSNRTLLNKLLDFAAAGFANTKSIPIQHGAWLTLNAVLESCGKAVTSTPIGGQASATAAATSSFAGQQQQHKRFPNQAYHHNTGGINSGISSIPSSHSLANLVSSSSVGSPITTQQHLMSSSELTAARFGIDHLKMVRAWDYVLHMFSRSTGGSGSSSSSSMMGGGGSANGGLTSSSSSQQPLVLSPEVKAELLNAIPFMAEYDKETFLRGAMSEVISSAIAIVRTTSGPTGVTVSDKNQVFLMIGKLSGILRQNISPFVDRIIRAIESNLVSSEALGLGGNGSSSSSSGGGGLGSTLAAGLSSSFNINTGSLGAGKKGPKKDRCFEAVTCLAMLAKADPVSVRSFVAPLLNPIFAGPPTVELSRNIASLCKSFPELRSACLDRMIALVRRQLSTVPIRNFLTANEAANTTRLLDAFNAIGECDCSGFSMLGFLSAEIAPRFWDPHHQVRRMAAELCSKLLLCGCHAPGSPCRMDASGTMIHVGASHIALILKLQQQLLAVAVADPEPDIRLATLAILDARFDHTLSMQDCVRAIFPALNDKHQNRAAAVLLLGRLSRLNPAAVFPTLRKVLVQSITEIEYFKDANTRGVLGAADERKLEQSTSTLGEVVAAAPELVHPYRASLLNSTVERLKTPGTTPLVLTALLSCVGKLVKHTREQDLKIVNDLVPIVVGHILDSTSATKKQEAIRTLTSIVRATQNVNIYDDYPSLLPTLLSMLHGGFKEPWARRKDALVLMGAIGAVDPIRVKAILRQTKEGSEASVNFRARMEDLPPTVVNAVISVMRMASSNEEVLSLSAQALREIFVSGSMKMNEAIGFLDRIIPELRRYIAQSPGLREKFLKELALFVSFFKHHIRAYRDGIIETVKQQIRGDVPAVLNQCINLIIELRACLREEFKPYLPSLLPLLVGTLHDDNAPDRKSAMLILECFISLGKLLEGHLHVVLPEVVEVALKCPNFETRELAIVVISTFAKILPSLADHAARCIHCLLRILAEPLPTTKADPKANRVIPNSIHTQCLQALTAIAQNLGDGFAKFIPMVRPALATRFREDSLEYEREMQNYADAIAGGKTIHPEPPFQSRLLLDDTMVSAAMFQQQQQALAKMPESQRFKTLNDHILSMNSRNNDEEGWKPWLHQFCVQLLRASPSPALRVCSSLAQAHEPFARLLFYPSFASCFLDMNETRERVGKVISSALDNSSSVSNEVRQEILNLAEYMERVEEFASKSNSSSNAKKAGTSSSSGGGTQNNASNNSGGGKNTNFSALLRVNVLATHSERSNLYAKTIHYLETQFLTLTREFKESLLFGQTRSMKPDQWQQLLTICEQCIKLCNYLNNGETANGILSFIRKYYSQLTGDNVVNCLGWAGASAILKQSKGVQKAIGNTAAATAGSETAEKENANHQSSSSSSPAFTELSAQMYEKLQWWEQSLKAYEAKVKQDPTNPANLLGVMKSLEGLGDYPRLLDMYRAAYRRGNRRLLDAASATGARAAWLLQNWDDLRLATDNMPDEGYNNTIAQFYRAVLAAHNDNLTACQHHINECRRLLDPSLSGLISESYDRAYPRMVDLQQLSELEEICMAKRDPSVIPAIKELWQQRLAAMAHSPTEWQGTLANHTLVLSPQEELSTWIQFVALCRSNSRNVMAQAALSKLLNNQTVEEFLASLSAATSAAAAANGANATTNTIFSPSSAAGVSSPSSSTTTGAAATASFSVAATTGTSTSASPIIVMSSSPPASGTTAIPAANAKNIIASGAAVPAASSSSSAVASIATIRPIIALAALSHSYESGNTEGALTLLNRYVDSFPSLTAISVMAGPSASTAATSLGSQSEFMNGGIASSSALLQQFTSVGNNQHQGTPANAAMVSTSSMASPLTALPSALLVSGGGGGGANNGVESALAAAAAGAPSSPSSPSSSSSLFRSELAMCRARLSEWLTQKSSNYSRDENLTQRILSNLKEATLLDPLNGPVWRQWARVHHDVAESMSSSSSNNGNTANQNTNNKSAGSVSLLSTAIASPPKPFSAAEKDSHVVSAIEGYLSSIRIEHQLQDVLGFLSLWFTYGSRPIVNDAVVNGLPHINVNVWLAVLPQIIARIQADSPLIQSSVHNLLVNIAKFHPQALLYRLNAGIDLMAPQSPDGTASDPTASTTTTIAATVGATTTTTNATASAALSEADEEAARRRKPREKILAKIEELHGQDGIRMVGEARMDTQELIRCAVLWPERWVDELQSIHKQWCEDNDLNKVVASLTPLVRLMDDPRTSAEENFVMENGALIREAFRLMEEAAAIANAKKQHAAAGAAATTPPPTGSSSQKAKEAWGIFDDLYNTFDTQIKSISTLVMDFVSPRLVSFGRNQIVAVPGTYTVNHLNYPRIASFVPEMRVINSKQHPRRIGIIGSDGNKHIFLLKGHEDLRQDERVMQLLGLVNTVLETHNATKRRDCTIQIYSVTPLGDRAGLVGWVDGCDTLHAIIKEYRGGNTKAICAEQNVIKGMISVPEDRPMVIQKQELLERAHEPTQGMDIARSLWCHAPSSEVWLDRRTTFVRTLAAMSMVGHVLGLGDRHPSNLMLHNASGRVVHIDFGDCFEVAMHRQMYPEKVPFRLTRMLVNAMEVSGIDGLFRHGCESVMDVLRQEKTSMLAMLEAFIHDPLVTWQLDEEDEAMLLAAAAAAANANNANAGNTNKAATAAAAGAGDAAADNNAQTTKKKDSSSTSTANTTPIPEEVNGGADGNGKEKTAAAATITTNNNTNTTAAVALKHLGAQDLEDLEAAANNLDLTGVSIRSVKAGGAVVGTLGGARSLRHPAVANALRAVAAAAAAAAANGGAGGEGAVTAAYTLAAVTSKKNKQATKVIGRIREKLNGLEFFDENDFMTALSLSSTAALVDTPVTVAPPTAAASPLTTEPPAATPTDAGAGVVAADANANVTNAGSKPPTPLPPPSAAGVISSSSLSSASLPVADQVNRLIQQAIASENLCQHYQGWCAFW